MPKGLIRNKIIRSQILMGITFILLLLFLVFGVMHYKGGMVDRTTAAVTETYDTLMQAKNLKLYVHQMVSEQRGYLISKNDMYYESYIRERNTALNMLADLLAKSAPHPQQMAYLKEIQRLFLEFSDILDENIGRADRGSRINAALIDNTRIKSLFSQLDIQLDGLIEQARATLNSILLAEAEDRKEYVNYLLVGFTGSLFLLMLFNIAHANSISRQNHMEKARSDIEKRFALAMKSTSDGVYDWDIITDAIYLSERFWEMLGYTSQEIEATRENLTKLIHPEERASVWSYVNTYLQGQLSEFNYVYRMRHKSGRYVWVNARARALYNKEGEAIRLIGTHTDITAMKEEERRLEKEKTLAETANAAKSEFLANMSHEIRTPLNTIFGVSGMMEKMKLPKEARNLVTILKNSSQALLGLINDVLDLAKIESSEMRLEHRDFALDTLLEQVQSIITPKAEEKDLTFTLASHTLAGRILHTDEVRLRQVLINLLGNAVKFTPSGSVILRVSQDQAWLLFHVEDTGIGIPQDKMLHIFEKFEQADASTTRQFGGSGLGLSISQKLAHMMGGEIDVESTLGKGSTFTLKLPLNLLKEEENTAPQGKRQGQKKALASSPASAGKILVAEDYPGNIVVISFLLDSLGYQYDITKNGKEAVAAYQKNPYSIVLMDVQMPEMDGFQAAHEIRLLAEKTGAAPKIIAMTAHALAGDKERCLNAGMDDYITKPLCEESLSSMLLKYASQRP